MSEPVKFNLKRKKLDILLTNEDGKDVPYILQELSGQEMESYLEDNSTRIETEVADGGKVRIKSIKSYAGMFASLLHLCMRDAKGDSVPVEEINDYPHEVQKSLFELAQKICGLGGEDVQGN